MSGPVTIAYGGDRPGPGWHAHGTTSKRIWVIHDDRLCRCTLLKQRWLHVASGATRHDRPAWGLPNAPYGLDVVFFVIGLWLLASTGLHHVRWPWSDDRPHPRTVQRWAAQLAPDAARWEHAIRAAILEHVAPRHLEEILPAGGIPPPEGRARRSRDSADACQLRGGAWLLKEAARSLSISIRSRLVVARRRWPEPAMAPA